MMHKAKDVAREASSLTLEAERPPLALTGNGGMARPARRGLAGLTVADGLMVVIGLIAAVARFANLGVPPLSPGEAEAALASWQFSHGAPLTVPIASPAYFAFTNLLMGMGGDGDVAARLVPAVFGLLTVLLPWLWRGRLRPAVWLVAGLFLAVSPILVVLSRTAGGEAIALFALLLLVVAASRLAEGERWGLVAGVAVGLGLTSAPLFYSGLVTFLPAWWVYGGLSGVAARTWRGLALTAALVFVVVATQLLFFLAGFGAALALLPAWLAQFGLPAEGASVLEPVLALLRYEPALFVLGLAAVVWAIVADEKAGKQWALWLGLLLPLLLLQSAALPNAAIALIPGYLLVGYLAAELLIAGDWDSGRRTLVAAGSLGLLGMVLLVSAGRFTRLNLWTGGEAPLVILAALALVFAGIAVILALAWDNSAARRGAFLGLALLLLYWQWGTGWQLSQWGVNDARERWVSTATDDDVPVMLDLLGRVSRYTTNANTDLEIFSTVESPVLRWYFRDFEKFQFGPALPAQTQAAVLITPDAGEPQAINDYFGADFGLQQSRLPGATGERTAGAVISDLLHWWLFRESAAPVQQQRIIVWIRSNLATLQ